nr:phospholipid-transporting ATPase ABCA1-like [Drosophila kikkawai]
MSSYRRPSDSEVYSVGAWQKLKLLLWKNWILQKNQKLQLLVALVVPILFISVLVIMRDIVQPTKWGEIRYEPVPIENLSLFMRWVKKGNMILLDNGTLNMPQPFLCFTPDTQANAAIVETARVILSLNGSRPYESAMDMEKDMMEYNFMAGIEFGENNGGARDPTFPLNLTYSLRFPSELRTAFGEHLVTWNTHQLFEKVVKEGPRLDRHEEDYYAKEGFLPIQHALTLSWLSQASGRTDLEFPSVQLQVFPYRAHTTDDLMKTLREILPLIIVLAFMYPCSVVTRHVATEKELQLKEIMKMIGVENWLHWIAWFVKNYLMLIVIVVFIVAMFQIKDTKDNPISLMHNSHWLPILMFLHTYVIASICFCFLLAELFTKASTAAVVTCILWYITLTPYAIASYYYDRLGLVGKLTIAFLFSNSALGFGFHIIMDSEATGKGTTMTTMFRTVTEDDEITLFYVILTLTASALMYMGICLYVEQVFPGEYGIARKWNFLFKRQFWSDSRSQAATREKAGSCQTQRHVGIHLNNLQKSYGKFKAVKGLNLKMYRDEITVLLGHNGAGKTTTINMLTGIVAPTAGTALVNGYDIRTQLTKARQSLGICPQHNVLFMKMSVRDHIIFFSKLKGVRGKEAVNKEVSKYVGILGLEAKAKVAAERLSGGMKRKLSLCCAMCGNARVVLCDEPSSGIDAAGRKGLWELLQAEKKGRTVLLTTHYMDEADVLGDRIAILSDGKLQCHGTSFHLKKRYGTGYQLVCTMLSDCNVEAVTQLINRHLPYLKPERELGTELAYRLPHHETKKFPALLADLEENYVRLKLSGYGLSVATLEDVFMEVNREETENRSKGGQEGKNASPDFQSLVFDTRTRENRRFVRYLMCLQALMFKKVQISFRNYWMLLIPILLPVLILVLTILNNYASRIYPDQPPMQISVFQYRSSYVVLEDNSTTDEMSALGEAYAKHMELYKKRSQLLTTDGVRFGNFILDLDESWNHRLDYSFVGGVTLDIENTTVWVNNKPLHTAPLSLNLLHNAMARHYLGEEAGTYVINKPLPYSKDPIVKQLKKGRKLGPELATKLTMSMCFVTAFFAIPIIKERRAGAKLLQFLSGVDAFSYWITILLWDYLIFMLSALMAILTIAAFQESGYATFVELGRYYAVLLIFGLSGLSISYVFAIFFTDAATGFVRIAVFNLLTGCGFLQLYMTAQKYSESGSGSVIPLVFPHLGLGYAAKNLYLGRDLRLECLKDPENACIRMKICCNMPGYFAWKDPGILQWIVITLIVGILLFTFLVVNDGKLIGVIIMAFKKLCKSKKKRTSGGSSAENHDITDERMFVREMISSKRKDIPLLVDNIRKEYNNKLAVQGVSFHVANAECFGLLGINGAGKTSVFKMLTGDTEITSGDAYIDGLSVSTQMRKVRPRIGYCPQFDALFEDLTGRQNLRIYCLFRGIQRRFVSEISMTLALAFGFQNHLDKKTKNYSGGNKRKLSTAIAIIGNPSAVFLDEPTSGMDPGARRNLWRIMGLIRTAGKSLVLTSHSMDECEALCTRLTIMVDGEFKCLGSTQSLKNQYAKGLILKLKIKSKKKIFQRVIQKSSSSSAQGLESEIYTELDDNSSRVIEGIKSMPDKGFSNRMLVVNTFIMKHIPEAQLKDEYNGLLSYYIPHKQMLPQVFTLIESNQKILFIEDYLITQRRLEEIFLDFALNCEHREADVAKKK